MLARKRGIVALLALYACLGGPAGCAGSTDLDVLAFSDVPCDPNSTIAVVVAADEGALATAPVAARSTRCTQAEPTSPMGDFVLTPKRRGESIAFALMQRAEGGPADACPSATMAH